jgi:Uma2 family endonuclease
MLISLATSGDGDILTSPLLPGFSLAIAQIFQ